MMVATVEQLSAAIIVDYVCMDSNLNTCKWGNQYAACVWLCVYNRQRSGEMFAWELDNSLQLNAEQNTAKYC